MLEKTKRANKNEQSRDTGPRQIRMNNLETLDQDKQE